MMDETASEMSDTMPTTTTTKKARKGVPSRKATKNDQAKNGHARGKPARTELQIADMTSDELKLLRNLYTPKGPRDGKTLHELQKATWPKEKGTSKVRNTLRRLVKFGWLELQEPTKAEAAAHEKDGGRLYSRYRLTEKGRKRGLKD